MCVLTKCQGTGEMVSLYRGFRYNESESEKQPICLLYRGEVNNLFFLLIIKKLITLIREKEDKVDL